MADADDEQFDLDRAYDLATPDDNRLFYDDFAGIYDDEFAEVYGYICHIGVAEMLCSIQPGRGPVLDVGCGTGLVGEALASAGFGQIDGVDLSAEMLQVAGSKQRAEGGSLYRSLLEVDLTEPFEPEQRWESIVSAGTFTHGHLGPDVLAGLVHLGTPGAAFAIGVNAEHHRVLGFASLMERLVADGQVVDLEWRETPIYRADATHDHAGDIVLVALFKKRS